MKRIKKAHGAAAFESYYSSLFGSRWQTLRSALLQETQPIAFSIHGGKPYYLDRASIYAAQALPPIEEGECLDMCAAPGGKTLVLASCMGQKAHIQANELSRARRERLRTVLKDHLSEAILSRIDVTGFNAAAIPRYRQACYDRILLDAPCSSERHVITEPKHLAAWTVSRITMLAQRQWALLSAAFLLLKPCSFLVYATCSLTDTENDNVVHKLLKKYGKAVIIHNCAEHNSTVKMHEIQPFGIADALPCEKTAFGCRFLPDTCAGAGPLYFSLIEKVDAD